MDEYKHLHTPKVCKAGSLLNVDRHDMVWAPGRCPSNAIIIVTHQNNQIALNSRDVPWCVRKRRTSEWLSICYKRAPTTDYRLVVRCLRTLERASLLLGYIPKQSNRTQPVGTYLGASASEGQADGCQYVINVHQQPPTGCLFVDCGRSNERPYRHGGDHGCTLIALRLRTLERASLQVGCVVGARPAQGAATTTDKGLVRTLERAYIH